MITTSLFCLLAAASPIKVAAVRFNVVDVSESRAEFFTEHFADRLDDEGVDVITPREVQTMLGLERQKELLGCNADGTSCLAEIGSALGADGIAIGDIAKVGDGFQLNVKIISATDGRRFTARSTSVANEAALLEALTVAAKEMAPELSRELGKPLGPKRASTSAVVTREPSAVKKYWWVPTLAGAVIGAAGAVNLGLAEGSRARLDSQTLSTREANELLANGQTTRTAGWVSVGIGAAAVGAGVLMLLLGGDAPVTPVASVSSNGAVVGLSGSLP